MRTYTSSSIMALAMFTLIAIDSEQAQSQSQADLWFNTSVDGPKYQATVRVSSEPPAGLGVSTIIFTFNGNLLGLPSDPEVGDHLVSGTDYTYHNDLNTNCYSGSTLSYSGENEISVNIVYNYATQEFFGMEFCGKNGGFEVSEEGIDIVTVHFDIVGTDAGTNLQYVANGTDLFEDDVEQGEGQSPTQYEIRSLQGTDEALPVELLTFEVRSLADGATLSWQTASERNNAGFEVERMAGSGWERIGFVSGQGTTVQTQAYSFDDFNLPFESATISYRLRQVDFDGSFAYSPVVELERTAPDFFRLHGNYPNPFNPATVIRFELPETQHVRISVYDVLGRRVALLVEGMMDAGRHAMDFRADHLPSGSYLYRIEAGAHSATRRMLLVK